jgi:hypothetical protein
MRADSNRLQGIIMKKPIMLLLFPFLGIILFAGQASAIQSFSSRLAGNKPKVKSMRAEEVDPILHMALRALEEARADRLDRVPYVKPCPETRIAFKGGTGNGRFKQNNLVVTGYRELKPGSFSLDAVIESIGPSGRIDLSKNHMVFSVCKADQKQCACMKKALLEMSKAMEQGPPEAREKFKDDVIGYQKKLGLAPDGVLTDKTAKAIAGDLPVLDIQEMTSSILYPEKPRHVVFILPREKVAGNAKAFNRGIDSLKEAREHAISSADFRNHAKNGGEYVLFVFFLDRVNPARDLRTGFSRSRGVPPDAMTSKQYPLPGKWPVLVEPFQSGPLSDSDQLYLHILMRGFPVSEIRIL